MPSNHLILYCPLLLLPSSGDFPRSQFFTSGGQNIEASASASVLPMNIQDWFPLGLTSLISLQTKGLSRFFSNHSSKVSFFSAQLSLWSNSHIHTWLGKTIAFTVQTFVSKVMSLLFNMLSRFVREPWKVYTVRSWYAEQQSSRLHKNTGNSCSPVFA